MTPAITLRMFLGRMLKAPLAAPWNTDSLIREELFSVERLEEHAASLARAQRVTGKPSRRRDRKSVV